MVSMSSAVLRRMRKDTERKDKENIALKKTVVELRAKLALR